MRAGFTALTLTPPPLHPGQRYDISPGTSDTLSTLYDVGQIAGSFAAGFFSDHVTRGRRAPVCVLMMLLAAASLWFFRIAPLPVVSVLCVVSGFFMGGPANILSG